MHEYLRKHIVEEIDGAMDYLGKAIELKNGGMPKFAAKFYKMGTMEIEHANCMVKMFSSVPKPDTVSDKDFSAMQSAILDKYTGSMAKIEELKKLYLQ